MGKTYHGSEKGLRSSIELIHRVSEIAESVEDLDVELHPQLRWIGRVLQFVELPVRGVQRVIWRAVLGLWLGRLHFVLTQFRIDEKQESDGFQRDSALWGVATESLVRGREIQRLDFLATTQGATLYPRQYLGEVLIVPTNHKPVPNIVELGLSKVFDHIEELREEGVLQSVRMPRLVGWEEAEVNDSEGESVAPHLPCIGAPRSEGQSRLPDEWEKPHLSRWTLILISYLKECSEELNRIWGEIFGGRVPVLCSS